MLTLAPEIISILPAPELIRISPVVDARSIPVTL